MGNAKGRSAHEDMTKGDFATGAGSVGTNGFGAAVQPARSASDAATSISSINNNLSAILDVGMVLGGRYEIVEMLGLGGMGAVYKAKDLELDRLIALKVIRPDLANNAEILARFKQELLTARQVTHRNVIRIFDLGDAGGIKFITMEYFAGRDLRSLLSDRSKLPPDEAVDVIRDVCAGLAAAHSEGIIHRDLKPSNVMRDENGRVVVMDFGLARSMTTGGMTQTGATLGTIEYMSPEQARAEQLDARSDLFTVGLIFYELLTGQMPYKADSAIASLLKRSQERAQPVTVHDPSIPNSLSEVVSKCLERDRNMRFQSAQELIDKLDEVRGRRPPSVYPPTPSPLPPATQPHRKSRAFLMIAGAAVLAAVAVVATFVVMRGRQAGPASAHKPVTILLADFKNATSEDVFDGTLEPAFGLAMEGAPFITTYNRTQARKIADQIKPGAALDQANARLVAAREGIGVVVSGSVLPEGSGYKVSCDAVDAITGDNIASASAEANDKSSVLKAVGALANKVRSALGDTTPESIKLAQEETYTTASLEAAHEYAKGQELRYQGKSAEAVQEFLKAIQLDPNFGSAYGNLGALYYNMGNRVESLKAYKLAMEHVDRMTEREKYRIRGGYYLVTANGDKAVEEFSALVKQYPADSMGLNSLAYAYSRRHDNDKALETAEKALEIYPKNVPYRTNAALYAIYDGKYADAEREATEVLKLNPSYEMAPVTIGLAQVGEGKFDEATQTMQKLASLSKDGASYAVNGLADMALYRSDSAAAITMLQKGITENLANKNNDAAAKKYAMLAEAYLMQGKKAEAHSAIDRGMTTDAAAITFRAGRIYAALGDVAKASGLAGELLKSTDPMPQAEGKLVQGELALARGDARAAIQSFQESGRVSDTWLSRFDLARADIAAGAFTDANDEMDVCMKRRGETTDIFEDEEQTFRFFPATYYYQGLILAGLKSSGANDAFKNFLALKVKNSEDQMVSDARKRAGSN